MFNFLRKNLSWVLKSSKRSSLEHQLSQKEMELADREKTLVDRERELSTIVSNLKNIQHVIQSPAGTIQHRDIDGTEKSPDDTYEWKAQVLSPPVIPADVPEKDMKLVDKIEGHMHRIEAESLYSMARYARGTIVELGSFRGKSTVALLLGSQESGNIVHAVDPLITSDSDTDGSTIVNSQTDYEKFMGNTDPWKELLVFYRMKSRDVNWTSGPIDLLFIDAFHTYDEVRADFYHFYPYLSDDAVIAFHDYSPYKPVFPGIQKFVDELLDSGEWLWEDYRGALISMRRAKSPREVMVQNAYLRGAHQKILEYLYSSMKIQSEVRTCQEAIERATMLDGTGILLQGPYTRVEKNWWSAFVPQFSKLADRESIQASPLLLFEDSTVLGPPHALHEDITIQGGGMYSHWGDYLYFSSSDNTDPNENNRQYWILIKAGT